MPTINRRVLSNLIELIKPYISESVVSLDNWKIRRGKLLVLPGIFFAFKQNLYSPVPNSFIKGSTLYPSVSQLFVLPRIAIE